MIKPEYNIRKDAKSNFGIKFGPQTIEHIEKRMLKIRGGKHSEQAVINNSNGQKARNRKISIEERARLLSYAKPSSEQKKLKIGLANSRPDLWPCPNKSDCKCRQCLDKKNYNRREKRKQLNLIFNNDFLIVENANV